MYRFIEQTTERITNTSLTNLERNNNFFSDYYDTSENQIYLISAAGIAAVFAALGTLNLKPAIKK